jgi:phosphoglycolate phosphatase
MTTGVLFDLDGVLVDSRRAITGAMNHALESVGAPRRPPAELERFIGPPHLEAYTELVGAELAPACIAAYRERYAVTSLEETELVPGILDVVARLAAERPLAVATSKPHAFARPLIDALGLAPHFKAVVGPDLTATTERKPATVARALRALDAGPAPLVGDRMHDVEAALANGIECVGVLWGIGDEAELRAAGAARIVSTPGQLPGNL